MAVIFIASSEHLSASETSRFIRPLFQWLFPNITDAQLLWVHFLIRKSAHFFEYFVLGLLAARAFSGSSHTSLRKFWQAAAIALIVVYAFMDEFRQTLVPSRSGSIWDSLIDIAGGVTALVVFLYWQQRSKPSLDAE